MSSLIKTIREISSRIRKEIFLSDIFLFMGILCLGIFSRMWDFGKLPSGLIADEASIGVDSFSLLHFGVDHNGVSFPVHFISFGSGQNALYGYLLIPFIALLGLKMTTVKLPMLICSLLTLPLIYWVAQRTFDKRTALISMFFLAISPWHIMLSRIGLESNLLPFVFLLGYACLLKSLRNEKWFPGACVIFAVCLYSYVTAYLTIPLFLACALAILSRAKLISRKYLTAGIVCFIFTAIPIGLFILINVFGLNSIKVGPFTIPHLPTQPRFESETGSLVNQLPLSLLTNSWNLIKLLVIQSDGIIYNTIEPYGYFYGVTFPLVMIGVILLVQSRKFHNSTEKSLLLSWLAASLILGMIQPVNINRINIIFIPILICIAVAVEWLGKNIKPILSIAICSFFIAFISFNIDYHGEAYKLMADFKFHTGLLSAIQYASTVSNGPVCVTDKIDMPYIYVLFVEKPDPDSYHGTIQYKDATGPFRQVESLTRYKFGKENCGDLPGTVFLFRSDDGLPKIGGKYNVEDFNDYRVYTPKP